MEPRAERSPPLAERALEALDRAVARAEGEGGTELIVATPEDYRAAVDRHVAEVRARLDRVLLGRDPESGLDALLAGGALRALLPEVEAMVGFGDGEWRHKDVWKHTKQVVRQAAGRLPVRWAALLHDVGKVHTRTISPTGEVHFFGHAEKGARMFDRMNRRLALFARDDALRDEVRFLILNHLRANAYDASWSDSAVRRFAREMADCLEDLLALSRADITTKRPEKKRRGLRQIAELAERVRDLAERDAELPPLPGGIGDVLMHEFGLSPGRHIGDLKRRLEEAVLAGEIDARLPAAEYVAFVRDHAERFCDLLLSRPPPDRG